VSQAAWRTYWSACLEKKRIIIIIIIIINSVAFSPQANYTYWSTATGWRILVPPFVDRRVLRSQRGGHPTAVNLSFLDQSRYSFFQVVLTRLSGPRSRPTDNQKIW
jgi:hypothetical protein